MPVGSTSDESRKDPSHSAVTPVTYDADGNELDFLNWLPRQCAVGRLGAKLDEAEARAVGETRGDCDRNQ